MKAVICRQYGPPDRLKIEDIPVPSPGSDELLIKVHATTINDFDWSLVTGKPAAYRLFFGLTKPKHPVPGIELSGTVESIGNQVTDFQPGDAVYGDISGQGWGSYAEYCCVHQESVIHKPVEMSFIDAAAIPHASMLAWQGLVDAGRINKGQKILINGAGGGMGTFGVQIAKPYQAHITGIDAAGKLERMKSLGFDQVYDYKAFNFTESGEQYDLILDAKTTYRPSHLAKALKPGGKYVTVGGALNRLLQVYIVQKFGKKNMHLVALKPNKDLAQIGKLYQDGKLKPEIDGPYTLQEIPKLLQYFGAGKHTGKVVISMIKD
jgi:NADPH:quinone reductase-like Zn-dependent oxidoreductase